MFLEGEELMDNPEIRRAGCCKGSEAQSDFAFLKQNSSLIPA
jgi:hypothetical protein